MICLLQIHLLLSFDVYDYNVVFHNKAMQYLCHGQRGILLKFTVKFVLNSESVLCGEKRALKPVVKFTNRTGCILG